MKSGNTGYTSVITNAGRSFQELRLKLKVKQSKRLSISTYQIYLFIRQTYLDAHNIRENKHKPPSIPRRLEPDHKLMKHS
jgi:hypothetical protein